MEYFFVEYPGEMVQFFKRVIKFGMFTGCIITAILLYVLLWPSSVLKPTNMFDKGLKWCVGLRVAIFFLQLPVRWRLASMIWSLEGMNRNLQTIRLFEIIRTWEWTFCQYTAIILIVWLVGTTVATFWYPDIFVDQTTRRAVLTACEFSITVLIIQIGITIEWLNSLLNQWVDNVHVPMEKFREHTDTFTSCQEVIRTLIARVDKFKDLPIALDPDTGKEDPMRGIKIYIPRVCAICKADLNTNQETAFQDEVVKPSSSERVTLLPCGHILHTECVECWISQDHSKCPFCYVDSLSPRCWLKLKTQATGSKLRESEVVC